MWTNNCVGTACIGEERILMVDNEPEWIQIGSVTVLCSTAHDLTIPFLKNDLDVLHVHFDGI